MAVPLISMTAILTMETHRTRALHLQTRENKFGRKFQGGKKHISGDLTMWIMVTLHAAS